MTARGSFFTIEGIDGSGKTMATSFLFGRLNDEGYPTLLTREPTDTWYGQVALEARRQPALPSASRGMVLTHYFTADRIAHSAVEIKPMLDAGKNVVSDRYHLSMIGHQAAQGVELSYLLNLHSALISAGQIESPTVTFLLDIPVDVAMERLQRVQAAGKPKGMDEKRDRLAAIRETYRAVAEQDESIVVIDAHREAEKVLPEMLSIAKQHVRKVA